MTYFYDDYYDTVDHDLEELRAEARAQRAFSHRLARNPDCRDPDHPGCPACMGDESEEDDE